MPRLLPPLPDGAPPFGRPLATLWLLGLGIPGLVVLLLSPFGTPPPKIAPATPLPTEQILNGALLGLALSAALLAGYWHAGRNVYLEPYGHHDAGRLGGHVRTPWMVLVCAIAPAVFLATRRYGDGTVMVLWLYGSIVLWFETQRRTRRPMVQGAWTDPLLDRWRLTATVVPLAVLAWIGIGTVIVIAPDPAWRPVEWLLGIPWIFGLWGYEGMVHVQGPAKWRRRLIATILLIGIWPVMWLPWESVRLGYLALALAALAWLEQIRRRGVRERIATLRKQGLGAELAARYGIPDDPRPDAASRTGSIGAEGSPTHAEREPGQS